MSTTYAPPAHARWPHVGRWVGAVALAAALIGLGAWVLVDRHTGGGGATHDATTLIDKFGAAGNAGDATALRALVTSDFVMRSLGDNIVGAQAIGSAAQLAASRGVRINRIAPVIMNGDFATTISKYSEPGQTGIVVSTFQIKNGKIARLWGFEPGVTPPFDNAVKP